ncbi:MAG: ATPase inhibitor subunit zeta [Beijerinckiaceae bacterium]|nr:ATPase inhibitor subunit zeta [Beijerinckiaceae bacterium]
MSLFESRTRAFEAKFVHDEDVRFRARARRNRKLAAWAAERMSLSGDERAAYELFIIQLGVFYGDQGVRERLLHDLEKAGKPISAHRIRRMMDEELGEELTLPLRPHDTHAKH